MSTAILIDNRRGANKESAKASLRERKKQGGQVQEKLFNQLTPEGKDKTIERMLGGKHGGKHWGRISLHPG